MRIVIIGSGEVGSYLARFLVDEHHDVTMIDTDNERLRRLGDHVDIRTVSGSATNITTLEQAEVGGCELFLAMTNIDEVNMLCSLFAKKLGAESTVARISSEDAMTGHPAFFRRHLGLDMVINPSMLAAAEATAVLQSGTGSGIAEFGFGRIHLRPFEVHDGSPFTRRPIQELKLPGALIAAIIRSDGGVIIPRGDDTLRGGDHIFVICKPEALPHLQKGVGEKADDTKRVIIIGGGSIGAAVAHYFDHPRYMVKLFEDDRLRAHALADELKHVQVIHSDGGDIDALQEEYVEAADAFITTTGSDEKNIVTAVLAKEQGVQRTVAVVHKPQFMKLGQKLGLTASLAPRILAANQILTFVRGGNVNRIRLVGDGKAEVIEFRVGERSRLIGKPLMELGLPRGILVGGIISRDRAVIPKGQDTLQPGDTVIMFALAEKQAFLENLLRSEKDIARKEFLESEQEL